MLKIARHHPYQGGKGGSKTESIFNLIDSSLLLEIIYHNLSRSLDTSQLQSLSPKFLVHLFGKKKLVSGRGIPTIGNRIISSR
ncbi:MAG: hypothetical protein DWQ54_24745 [Microcystis flos-aquae TF09]|uniref:Uncharacterized protein n=1 Tax=Microcystis flos-aquae TF09 TaxID=2060473 RepID=A0A3E0KWB3_9CHRO|nr:MAG: hypothetical protein DWQ54_24745 [Microcystis flos-aquae TF09]